MEISRNSSQVLNALTPSNMMASCVTLPQPMWHQEILYPRMRIILCPVCPPCTYHPPTRDTAAILVIGSCHAVATVLKPLFYFVIAQEEE